VVEVEGEIGGEVVTALGGGALLAAPEPEEQPATTAMAAGQRLRGARGDHTAECPLADQPPLGVDPPL
jgi:hypothetical protein